MTKTERDSLRYRAAECIGGWHQPGSSDNIVVNSSDLIVAECSVAWEADYIEACSPERIIALLDALDEAERYIAGERALALALEAEPS